MAREILPLQADGANYVSDTLGQVVSFLPRLVGAIVILAVGWLIGRFVGSLVSRLVDGIELDRMVLETPLGRVLGGTERAVSDAFGMLGRWFVYAIAILAAANTLAIPELSAWISQAVSYLPAFIAGLAVIVVGFVVADFVGDVIERTRAATETAYTSWFANGARIFLYFTAIVIGLDTMGIDVNILYVFAQALAWGLAAALAIGVGVAVGWGGKDYVSENIGDWMGRAGSVGPGQRTGGEPGPSPGPGDDDD